MKFIAFKRSVTSSPMKKSVTIYPVKLTIISESQQEGVEMVKPVMRSVTKSPSMKVMSSKKSVTRTLGTM